MEKVIGIVKKKLGNEADQREDYRAGRAVKEALQRVHKALALNPDFSPFGPIPYGDEKGIGGGAAGSGPEEDHRGRGQAGRERSTEDSRQNRSRKSAGTPWSKRSRPTRSSAEIKMGENSRLGLPGFFWRKRPGVLFRGKCRLYQPGHPLFQEGIAQKRQPIRCTSPAF